MLIRYNNNQNNRRILNVLINVIQTIILSIINNKEITPKYQSGTSYYTQF